MEQTSLTHSPFAVLTFIVAPALLTNSTSVLALSTINRMLRTRERMNELFARFEAGGLAEPEAARLVEQVNRVEKQAVLLLRALHSIYVALGAFAAATQVGAVLGSFQHSAGFRAVVALGLVLGFGGRRGRAVRQRESVPGHATLVDQHSRRSRAHSQGVSRSAWHDRPTALQSVRKEKTRLRSRSLSALPMLLGFGPRETRPSGEAQHSTANGLPARCIHRAAGETWSVERC